MKEGDYLLCYLTGISCFIAILEVISKPFFDKKKDIWEDEFFPCRLNVKTVVELTPDTSVPVYDLKDRLSFFKDFESKTAWTGRFRGSPSKWNPIDAKAVVDAIFEAKQNPIVRVIDLRKYARRPRALRAKIGFVTIPDLEVEQETDFSSNEMALSKKEPKEHTEIQFTLLKLGSDMGFDLWVARNDRNKDFKGKRFQELPRLKTSLPLQFDEATNRTIELIDVLWLKGNAIIAAFEIESTTSIYSGLLRMSDLITMQPNLNIPLYLVAPDERRNKVITEVNRPTFSRLDPPLAEICRFISFSKLREEVEKVKPVIKFIKPEYIEELSESCEIEDVE